MDPFNVKFGDEYIRHLLAKENIAQEGFWLEKNIPLITSFTA